MTGKQVWNGHPALSRPMTILGVERRWFLLSMTLGLAMWNAINSLFIGGVICITLYAAGWIAWKRDPHMLSIIQASASSRARYDPGKWPAWRVELHR